MNKTWLPIKVEDFDGHINDSALKLYALTFTDSACLISRTLGTSLERISKYNLTNDKLELSDELGSGIVDILKLTRGELKMQFDSFNIVTYIPFPDEKYKDQTAAINDQLANESWYLKGSQFDMKKEVLIEFKDSLEDRIVKPPLRKELNAAVIHTFENNYSDFHLRSIWGVNYFDNTNIISLSELEGNGLNSTIIITEISDSLISGYEFIDGDKSLIQLSIAKTNFDQINKFLLKEWVLKGFEEVKDEYGEYWSSFGGVEKGLKMDDLENNKISLCFNKNQLFSIKVNRDTLTHGTWRLSNSGKLIELTSRYLEDGHNLVRNHFLTMIKIDSNQMKIFRRENIESSEGEFARVKFIENYEPAIDDN
ncbi:MAG: hypothetical protein RIB54_04795 [Fulvivirga sp.]|uniref:hypothetical protein n=2 Tax=Fulvivirga sp. TaxID=1931237 RepID=UPI0032EAEA86